MTLIVAVYVPTGIVLSGDSRTTGTINQSVAPSPAVAAPSQLPVTGGPTVPTTAPMAVQTNVILSDSAEKVFLVHQRFGIATFGEATVNNMPIAHYVEDFQATPAAQNAASTLNLASALLAYFKALLPVPNAGFVLVGYDGVDPWVVQVDLLNNQVKRVNALPSGTGIDYGLFWGGDSSVVTRLLSQPQFNPPFNVMNVQDAVDFSRHLIRSTIDQMRFEPRFASVGGPIDTLVASPAGARFLARKELHCS